MVTSVVKLHARDNVAIVLDSIRKGQLVSVGTNVFEAVTAIPRLHKIALSNIRSGEEVVKYGQIIGHAGCDVSLGEHVHGHNCEMAAVDRNYEFCKRAVPVDYVSESERATFKGFRRENGKAGTRNYIGILSTVNCSGTVARQIATEMTHSGELDQYPNIDGVVALTHETGCGMRSDGEGYDTLMRTFEGYLAHPNFGGLLLIGLGCESMQVESVLEKAGLTNSDLFSSFTIQVQGGTRQSVANGLDKLRKMLPLVNQATREECPASELVVALQCGGSDALSGVTVNPSLGCAADLFVRHGGSVIYSETPEIFGAEHLLTQRARTKEVGEKLLHRIAWWKEYTRNSGFELNNNPSPGNKAGGLTTILEKSLGAQAKSGSTMLMDVVKYAEPLKTKGLVFMDSPGFDPVSVTGQVASGATIVCFTTGRGSAFGFKPTPSIKLASNSEMYNRMIDDMDVNCGSVIDSNETLEEAGQRIFHHVLAIASGQQSKSEQLGYGDTEFNPWKIGAVV